MLRLRLLVGIFLLGIVLGTGGAFGQAYPSKTIRIITGGIGGSNDFASRLIAPPLAVALGQPVIVENRGGGVASGEAASKAPPDGYTLLVTGGTLWIGPVLRKFPFDPVRDFAPITIMTIDPNVLIVHPSLPVKSVKDLIALAKARPGELNYSFGSIGGLGHIGAELFKAMTGVNMQGVPYKTDSQETNDLLAGYVQMRFQDWATAEAHIASGKVKPLAVTSATPSALAPNLPTLAASGLPGYEVVGVTGMFAPAKTPEAIIKQVNQAIVRVLNQPDIKQKFIDSGSDVVGSSPEVFANKIKSEMARWGKLLKDAGIKVE